MDGLLKKIAKLSLIAIIATLVCVFFSFPAMKGKNSENLIKTDDATTQTSGETTQSGNADLFESLNVGAGELSKIEAYNASRPNNTLRKVNFNIAKLGDGETVDYTAIVAFVNLSGGPKTWAQNDIDSIMLALNDDDRSNNIYSVREYFEEQTYGKLRFSALYVEFNSTKSYYEFANKSTSGQFSLEYYTFSDALTGTKGLKDENGNVFDASEVGIYHCSLLYFPYDSTGWGTILWPHSWSGQAFVSTPFALGSGENQQKSPFMATYAHEFTHVLGIKDMYVYEDVDETPVGIWDLMASHDRWNPQSLSAYFKQYLGLTGESDYAYKDNSKVREVSGSGEYKLAPTSSQTGTIALKIAEHSVDVSGYCSFSACPTHYNNYGYYTESGKESFYIEYKKQSSSLAEPDYYLPSSGLIIYRVVESIHTKLLGNSRPSMLGITKYQVYVLRPDNEYLGKASVAKGATFGTTTNTSSNNTYIRYFDGTNTRIQIKNNGYDSNGNACVQITFADDIDTCTASGTFAIDGEKIANAKILISTPDSKGNYNSSTQTYGVTDADGYFYVKGLKKGAKLSFVVKEKTYNNLLTVNGNVYDAEINHRLYSITGTFRVNNALVSGAKVMISTLDASGTRSKAVFSGVYTDSNGYYSLKGLENGTRISFEWKNQTYESLITIENADKVDYGFNYITADFKGAKKLEGRALTGTLYINGEKAEGVKIMVSTPDENGNYSEPVFSGKYTGTNGFFFLLELKEGTKVTFEKDGKTFDPNIVLKEKNIVGTSVYWNIDNGNDGSSNQQSFIDKSKKAVDDFFRWLGF